MISCEGSLPACRYISNLGIFEFQAAQACSYDFDMGGQINTSHIWQWLTMTLQRTWATADKEWHLHTWHLHVGNCHNWIKAGGTHLPSLIGRLGHYINEYLRTLKRTNNLTSLAQPTWHTIDTVAMARHDEAFLAMSPSSTESVRPPIVHISNVKINANNVQNKNKNDTPCQRKHHNKTKFTNDQKTPTMQKKRKQRNK